MTDVVVFEHEQEDAAFAVTVNEDGEVVGEYVVLATEDVCEQYDVDAPVESLVQATFYFLLDHEGPESILKRFQLQDVEQYFPEYPEEIHAYLKE